MGLLTDYTLDIELKETAQEIVQEADTLNDALDRVHEVADSDQRVIYYSKAHDFCRSVDTTLGEDFVAECYSGESLSYDKMATLIAYGEISARLNRFVHIAWENQEEAENEND